ncbi:hypothetical protein FJTKL_08277 [Diaporthe vaccinii]|uniref:Uncharacterized protein n=1 Tax=Diaporthe vaccinii TaxID=105482 RepID=A0ABR4ESC8_9PEZI
MIVIRVRTCGSAAQTCRRFESASFFRASCLAAVVMRMSSYGWQAKMLWSEGRSSSIRLWIVGITTVTSSGVKLGFSGMGFDL